MTKPLTTKELTELRAHVHRGITHMDAVAFITTVVPRMLATIDAQQEEIKRVSDALADELLDSTPIAEDQPDDTVPDFQAIDLDDFDLYDPDNSREHNQGVPGWDH